MCIYTSFGYMQSENAPYGLKQADSLLYMAVYLVLISTANIVYHDNVSFVTLKWSVMWVSNLYPYTEIVINVMISYILTGLTR